jgi:hypothetical protein
MAITELIPIIPIVDDAAITRLLDQGETAGIKLCAACGYELRGRDRFCRHCGVERAEGAASPFATVPFAAVNPDRPISGPLAKAVVDGVTTGALSRCSSVALKKTVLALISIPIWMIIILLSPLDVFVIVKAATNQIGKVG